MKPMKPEAGAASLGLALGLAMSTTLHADTFGSGANQFTMDFVKVRDPGNANDSGTTGSYHSDHGGVGYVFRIGTYVVSEEMIDKANAAGGLGITSVYTRGAHKPATDISWYEAARFVNWLNEEAGYSHAYKFALQPGDAGYSSEATIELWQPGEAGYDPNNLYRNSTAYYFLPSEDEWYKAAYYSGSGATYYDYATGSNTIPAPVASGTASGTEVYNQSFTVGPADIDQAGGLSPYGTMGQGGNVSEWYEGAFDGDNSSATKNRGIRGSSWYGAESYLRSSERGSEFPAAVGFDGLGFRVASAPEPSAALLMGTGLAALLARKRSRRSL